MSSAPAESVKKLEDLNTEFPDNPDILLTLSDAYMHLPGNNHLRAAVHLERVAKLIRGQKNTWLRAARLFAEAGDIPAQLENLCLHLQHYPQEEAWLDLGQILIQSDRQEDLEVAQQILFGKEEDRPDAVQLQVLLVELQKNSLITEGSTARGLKAVQTLRLIESGEDHAPKELVPILLPDPPEATGATSPTSNAVANIETLSNPQPTGSLPRKAIGSNPTTDSEPEVILAVHNIEIIENQIPETTPPPQATSEEKPDIDSDLSTPHVVTSISPTGGVASTSQTGGVTTAEPPNTSEEPIASNTPTIENQPPTDPPTSQPDSTPSTIEQTNTPETTDPHPPKEKQPEEDPLMLAQQAFDLKDYDTASTLYWKAVRSDMDNPVLWFKLSQSFFRQDELKKAEMMALEAARRDPDNSEYVVHFLKVIREQKDPENLHAELKKARKLFPDDPFVIYELAVSYANTDGDIRAAIILFNEFVEKHPDHKHASHAKESLEQLKP